MKPIPVWFSFAACAVAALLFSSCGEPTLQEPGNGPAAGPGQASEGDIFDNVPVVVPADVETPDVTPVPSVTPAPGPTPSPASGAEPDWTARGKQLMAELAGAFKAPKPGDSVQIGLRASGRVVPAKIVSLGPDSVTVAVAEGEVTYDRTALQPQTQALLFADAWAYPQARSTVEQERQAWFQKRLESMPRGGTGLQVKVTPGQPVNGRGGEVIQVVEYLRATLSHPESLRFVRWGRVTPHGNGFVVTASYEARSGSLGKVIESRYFFMTADGQIHRTAPFKGVK